MAGADDINSTLQGVVRNLSQWTKAQGTVGSFFLNSTLAVSNVGTTASLAVAANTTRSVLLFHNPGDSVALLLAPATDANNAAITATFSSRGGGYILLPQDYLPLTGANVQLAWNVAAQSGTTNPLTVGAG